jgi:hypothetical protein
VPPIVVREELQSRRLVESARIPEVTESFYAIVPLSGRRTSGIGSAKASISGKRIQNADWNLRLKLRTAKVQR